jgi:hypothetical protein
MTDLLKDVMTDRADAASALTVDLDGVMRAGDRRIRRRRTLRGIGAAAVATAVAAGGFTAVRSQTPDHSRGGDPAPVSPSLPQTPGPAVPLAFTADVPTWADGTYIHYGDRRIEVARGGVGVLAKTDAGLVYTNAEAGLVLTDGRTSEILSRTPYPELAAAETGTLVAWLEGRPDSARTELVVYDTRRRYQVFRSTTAGRSSADGSHRRQILGLLGMDDDAVYLNAEGSGVVRRDLATGATRTVPGDPMTWQDTAAGKFVHDRRRGSKAVVIGSDLGGTAPAILATRADLSPGGRRLATDFDDVTKVFDVASRAELPLAHPEHPVVAPAQWLSDDQLVVVGYRTRTQQLSDPVDLLVCTVSSGSCTVLARKIGRYANAINYFDAGDPDMWNLAFPGRAARY